MSRVCVASRSFSRHPLLRQELLARYPETTFNDAGASLAGDALIDFLQGHDKAVIALERIDAGVLDAVPGLKVIAKYGVGFDKIDLHALIERGVALGWTGGVNRRSVAELVIAFAISMLRHVPAANAEVLGGTWRQLVGRQISDCTVGIIGCGHVGKELAVMLRAGFGCEVLAHDTVDFSDFYAEHGIIAASLETLLAESDVVSLHLPLDTTTKNFLDAAALAAMKPGAVLINTARGGLVDERALKAVLLDGTLGGAAFDVFAFEPPEDEELLALANFLATPHIGGSAAEAILAMGRAAIRGLDEHRAPEPGLFPPGRW
ncbi:phosphoglycerate dehydrogenase [Thalassospiraceae bacterium LMO-JJ14]|nr:phosphoglycerate dehydrogenase [Thalassospiraceae bacterium LMO-JJ14]